MSKKKDKDKPSVEEEITRLCDSGQEAPIGPEAPPSGLQSFFSDFLQQQASQHQELMRSFASSSQNNVQAVVTAVKDCINIPKAPRPPVMPPPVVPAPPPVPKGLFSYEPDEEDVEYSSEEDYDFMGWDIPVPPSGQNLAYKSRCHVVEDLLLVPLRELLHHHLPLELLLHHHHLQLLPLLQLLQLHPKVPA